MTHSARITALLLVTSPFAANCTAPAGTTSLYSLNLGNGLGSPYVAPTVPPTPDANVIGHLPTTGLRLVPSDAFLWLAGGSVLISLGMRLLGRRDDALFIGEWVPTMVGLGVLARLTGR